MSLISAIQGGLRGFSQGGWVGAIAGAAGSLVGGNKNPARTKNTGIQPGVNTTKGTIQQYPTSSPVPYNVGNPVGIIPTGGSFSANPVVRSLPMPGVIPVLNPGGTFGGAGATSQFPTVTSPNMQTSMALYRRFVTKKGTLRRVRRDGQPYAIPHMNPMNVRAARRAVRRIKSARKLLQRIERTLPKARSTSRSRSSSARTEFIRQG